MYKILAQRAVIPVQELVISMVRVLALTDALEIPFWLSSTIQIMSPGFILLEVLELELIEL